MENGFTFAQTESNGPPTKTRNTSQSIKYQETCLNETIPLYTQTHKTAALCNGRKVLLAYFSFLHTYYLLRYFSLCLWKQHNFLFFCLRAATLYTSFNPVPPLFPLFKFPRACLPFEIKYCKKKLEKEERKIKLKWIHEKQTEVIVHIFGIYRLGMLCYTTFVCVPAPRAYAV